MKITIEWLGGATLRISSGDFTLVTDPLLLPKNSEVDFGVFQSTRLDDPAGDKEKIAQAGLWLFTHSHRDHWDEMALEAIPEEGLIVHAPDCRKILRRFRNKSTLRPKRNFTAGTEDNPVEITAVKTIHSRNPWFRPLIHGGNGYGLNLQEGEQEYRIYLTGDSLIAGAQRRFIQNFKPQLIIANAGLAYPGKGKLAKWTGPLTMGKSDLYSLAEEFPNSRILPVHWGTFSHYRETYNEIDFHRYETIRLLEPGEIWEIQR